MGRPFFLARFGTTPIVRLQPELPMSKVMLAPSARVSPSCRTDRFTAEVNFCGARGSAHAAPATPKSISARSRMCFVNVFMLLLFFFNILLLIIAFSSRGVSVALSVRRCRPLSATLSPSQCDIVALSVRRCRLLSVPTRPPRGGLFSPIIARRGVVWVGCINRIAI